MESLLPMLLPSALTIVFVRLLLSPIRLAVKLGLHCACGFSCLWLLSLAAPVTGTVIPINPVTVLTAGVLGLPGIGLLALLAAF